MTAGKAVTREQNMQLAQLNNHYHELIRDNPTSIFSKNTNHEDKMKSFQAGQAWDSLMNLAEEPNGSTFKVAIQRIWADRVALLWIVGGIIAAYFMTTPADLRKLRVLQTVLLPISLLAIYLVMSLHRSAEENIANFFIYLPFVGILAAVLAPNLAYYAAHAFQSTIDPTEWTSLQAIKEAEGGSRLAAFVNVCSAKALIVMAILTWSMVSVRTAWVFTKSTTLKGDHSTATIAKGRLFEGVAFSTTSTNEQVLVSKYEGAPSILHDYLNTKDKIKFWNQIKIAAVHRDILWLVLVATLVLPNRRLVLATLKFLLPFLLVPLFLQGPHDDGNWITPAFYGIFLLTAAGAMLWNCPFSEDDISTHAKCDGVLGRMALVYNLLLLFLVFRVW
jgi:hypothetical protein